MPKAENIDQYLKNTEGTFAFPILCRVREIVHGTVPNVREAIKWGSPSFEYKGLMMSMVAFKRFAAVWFYKGALLEDPENLLQASSEDTKSMRKYVIPSIDELNEEGLRKLILEAVEKQDKGEQVKGFNTRRDKWSHSALLSQALQNDPRAKAKFEELTAFKQREFVEHIESAKQETTKQRRLEKDLELIRRGIGLHDKYRK